MGQRDSGMKAPVECQGSMGEKATLWGLAVWGTFQFSGTQYRMQVT